MRHLQNYFFSRMSFSKLRVNDYLKCPICLSPAQKAVECVHCQKIFCRTCAEDVMNTVSPSAYEESHCPNCRRGFRIRPAKFAEAMIVDMKGLCPHEGCGARMRVREFPVHQTTCWNGVSADESEELSGIIKYFDQLDQIICSD